MRKITKAIVSSFLAFAMIFAAVIPVFAVPGEEEGHTTTLHITKLQAENYPNPAQDHDGRQLELGEDANKEGTVSNKLGKVVKGLDGVTFTYWKVTEEQFKKMKSDPKSYDTVAKVKVLVGTEGTTTDETKGGGLVDIKITTKEKPLEYYWFVESKKPENVSSAVAVPFGITLPLTNPKDVGANGKAAQGTPAGTILMTDVYIYPKNVTGDLPEADKTVDDVITKSNTKHVGEEITWFLQASVPAENIKEYIKFELSDTLDTKLSYVKGQNVEVFYSKPDGNSNKVDLFKGTDYEINEPSEAKGGKLEIKFTTEGIKKLSDNFVTVGNTGKVFVKFKTVINETAEMGKEILNDYTLTFKNNPNNEKDSERKPPYQPKVLTGGKKFIKTNDKDLDAKALDGAEFIVTNTLTLEGSQKVKYLKQTVETSGSYKNEWVDEKDQATKFESKNGGKFEIKGLQYSKFTTQKWDGKILVNDKTITNNYALIEVKAPSGYAKINDPIKFEINETSYRLGNILSLEGTSDPITDHQQIMNKELTIPQTGGIGTIIFTVVGIAIMGVAVYAMKKRNAEEK